MSDENLTPMMKQYMETKEKEPDAFLFFRCGDFYEMFYTDAVEASSILDITLTKRGDVPMCGVPYHAVDVYVAKMIRAGKKIAICEQVEDPKLAKGIVKREVTQIITPGTLIEEKLLPNKSNNFLLALNKKGFYLETACLDLSTGDFEVNEIEYSESLSELRGEMLRINPREIIIPEDIWINYGNIRELFEEHEDILINRYPAWHFESQDIKKRLLEHFNVGDLKELVRSEHKTGLTTAGVVLDYVRNNSRAVLNHIGSLSFHDSGNTMTLDETTIRNLEVLNNLRDGSSIDTLLEVLDDTVTSMGGRLLKKWLIEPLININEINKRLSAVNCLYHNQNLLTLLRKALRGVMDLERLSSRIVMNRATPKDLVSIKHSLTAVNEIKGIVAGIGELKKSGERLINLRELIDFIEKTIREEPSTFINEGNIVKDGYSKELDELKSISFKSKEHIASIEEREKEKFNVSSLRVKYNKILGYFFEVSKLQSKNLVDTYILRQSLVNTHRYMTLELSEYESTIIGAREKINGIEEGIFYEVKDRISASLNEIQENARIIAGLDVFSCFAAVATARHYVMPEMDENNRIYIRDGRHPVVEQKLESNDFIPNDLDIDNDNDYLLIITGPNMSGKSTYLRQSALIVYMAQIGSFVPASEARIGIVDRIFTRIGTSDNLARGESTFLVEMMETAGIVKNATCKSLIIMDEIGRGTSTYDGLSIAWAVLEYIYNRKILGAKTLFATHYHELTALESKKGVKNLSVAISEENNSITFLHKIIEGAAGKSYGIHVAGLAGMPEEIVMFASGLLKKLEDDNSNNNKMDIQSKTGQLELFDADEIRIKKTNSQLFDKIAYLDLDKITPIEALNMLIDMQKKVLGK